MYYSLKSSKMMTLSLCVECSCCPPLEASHNAQVGRADLEDMPGAESSARLPLLASAFDDYVHINHTEVEPPEEPLPDADLKRQEHLKALRQQVPTPSLPPNTTANL